MQPQCAWARTSNCHGIVIAMASSASSNSPEKLHILRSPGQFRAFRLLDVTSTRSGKVGRERGRVPRLALNSRGHRLPAMIDQHSINIKRFSSSEEPHRSPTIPRCGDSSLSRQFYSKLAHTIDSIIFRGPHHGRQIFASCRVNMPVSPVTISSPLKPSPIHIRRC
jgi:hypothetical protein